MRGIIISLTFLLEIFNSNHAIQLKIAMEGK